MPIGDAASDVAGAILRVLFTTTVMRKAFVEERRLQVSLRNKVRAKYRSERLVCRRLWVSLELDSCCLLVKGGS